MGQGLPHDCATEADKSLDAHPSQNPSNNSAAESGANDGLGVYIVSFLSVSSFADMP